MHTTSVEPRYAIKMRRIPLVIIAHIPTYLGGKYRAVQPVKGEGGAKRERKP